MWTRIPPAEEAGVTRGLVIYQAGRYEVTLRSKQIEGLLEPVASGSVVDFTVGVVRRVRNASRSGSSRPSL